MKLLSALRLIMLVLLTSAVFRLRLFFTSPELSTLTWYSPETETSAKPATAYGHENATFCIDWDTDMDSWWTNHPEWSPSLDLENDTHQCFSRITDPAKASFFRRLYNVQFYGNCSNVTTKVMWSSGWGADFKNVDDGLLYALETSQPVQMQLGSTENAWHYAGEKRVEKKNASQPACPSKDMFCYFLNISSCAPEPAKAINGFVSTRSDFHVNAEAGSWAYEFATRQQTWLRRAVYDYSSSVQLTTPCTAIHVRRTDVILHGQYSRKYHAIKEYIEEGEKFNMSKNIFLLTDDQNAIDEATALFPEYNWMYLNRVRHRGAEGGWENQIPSNDHKQEVIALLSTFRLVRQCSMLVHTCSSFADHLYNEMDGAVRVNIDDGKHDVANANNTLSANISKSNW